MEVKNLLGKLHANQEENTQKPVIPPIPRKIQNTGMNTPLIEDNVKNNTYTKKNISGGRSMSNDDIDNGIILDLGEGISLNIPIQKRMTLTDFIKLAEKVKALEMLSENSEMLRKGHF